MPCISRGRFIVHVITFASLKGGVGKTSCAIFLSQALAENGANKVLVVDLDSNNNLTDYFLRSRSVEELESKNVLHVLLRGCEISEAIYHTDYGVDVLPATLQLAKRVQAEASNDHGIVLRFPSLLKRTDYDFVVIDGPPHPYAEMQCSVYAANHIIVPVAPNRWAVNGYLLVLDELKIAQEITGQPCKLSVLPCCVSEKESIEVREMPEWAPLKSSILRSSSVKNAGNRGLQLKQDTIAWNEFLALSEELQSSLQEAKI
jgi:chromosome partitioning protein